MKYCMNCGTKLEDDAEFCPECGMKQNSEPDAAGENAETSVDEMTEGTASGDGSAAPDTANEVCDSIPETGPEKPFFKKPAGIAVIVAAAVLVIGVIVFACIMNSPKVMLMNAIKNTAGDIMKIPAVEFMGSVGEHGSVSTTVNMEEMLKGYGLDVDGELVCTEYFDSSKSSTAVIADFRLHDSSAVDAGLWVSPDSIILNSKVLFGKDAYGVGIKSLQNNLKKSDLADSIPDDLCDALEDADPRIFEDSDKCEKILAEYITDVSAYLGKQVVGSAEFEKSSDEVDFPGSTVKAKVITVTVDGDSMQDALKNTLKYAEKDPKFDEAREILESYLEFSSAASGDNEDGGELLDYMFEELDDSIDRMDDLEVESRFYIYKSRLVKVEFEESETDSVLSIALGPDPANPELCEIAFEGEYFEYRAGIEVETNTSSEYEAKLYLNSYGEDKSIDFSWDKKNDDFSVKAGEQLSISGTMVRSGGELSLTVDKIKLNGEKQDIDIAILVKTKDKMPEAPEYKEILAMDEDEIIAVVEDAEDSIGELLYQW